MTREMTKSNTEMRWSMQDGMWKFGAASPSEWMRKFADYTMNNIADKITCHMLVIDSEAEQSFPGQAKKLYDALTCPKKFMLFKREETAEEHCQIGAAALSHQRIFDWLDKTFARIAGEQS